MIQMVSNIKVISVEKLKGLLLKIPTPTPTLPPPQKKKKIVLSLQGRCWETS